MINTLNQTILSLLAALRAKASGGAASITSVSTADAQILVDFVNNTANSVESGLAALTIAMQNAGGLTSISDIITAATAFDTFIYEAETTTTTTTE